jgi:hypothetical protein
MPSSWTVNLGLEKPATGEQAGTWGTTANKSYDFLDTGIDGNVTIALSTSAYTLMTSQGTASNGRNKVIIFTGALTQDGSITIDPNTAEKIYFIINQTTGGFGLVMAQGTGATYRIAPGKSAVVYSTGLGGAAGVYGVLANFQCDSLLATTINVTTLAFTGAASFAQAVSFTAGVTISPSLVLNLGSDAAYDMYYRNASGQMARLGNGTAGQVLVATATGPAWQTSPPPSLNMAITNSTPNYVFYANASSQLAQDANHQWLPSTGLGVGMAPARAVTVGRGLPASIMLDSLTPNPRELVYTSAGVLRWNLRTTLETENPGTNVASNLQLMSYNDSASSSIVNQSWFRSGRVSFGQYSESTAQVAIFNTQAGQTVLEVNGMAGQTGLLQTWRNSANTVVASIDNAGTPFFAAAPYLKLDTSKRLDINGTATGHPVGTLHIGADTSGNLTPCIALERCPSIGGGLPMGLQVMRIFQRSNAFIIQFDVSGVIYYFVCAFPGGSGPVTWNCTTTPP